VKQNNKNHRVFLQATRAEAPAYAPAKNPPNLRKSIAGFFGIASELLLKQHTYHDSNKTLPYSAGLKSELSIILPEKQTEHFKFGSFTSKHVAL